MKKYAVLLMLLLWYNVSQGQQSNLEILKTMVAKMEQLAEPESKIVINNQTLITNPLLSSATNSADSAALNTQVVLNERFIRFDPAKVVQLYPEVTTIQPDNRYQIDYHSFIPILMDVIIKQQKVIDDFSNRVFLLEEALKKIDLK
jgi:hypothetical protein